MKQRWHYSDIVDLEYCLEADRDRRQAELHERDRNIFLSFPETSRGGDRSRLIHRWLQARRTELFTDRHPSPGEIAERALRTLLVVLATAGLALGLGAGLAFFTYSGTTPVNVLLFLFLFVFSQLVLLVLFLVGLSLRLAGFTAVPKPIVAGVGRIAAAALNRSAALADRLPASARARLGELLSAGRTPRSVPGAVFYWPLFTAVQLLMLGFNGGLLAATLFRLLTSDIAFGWQSTVQFGAPLMHRLVQLLAVPWSWLVPEPLAYPSLVEIEGSRIILKDGILHLATENLVSWWPFLVFCLLFYGLILRLLLIAGGRFGQYLALRRLSPRAPALARVLQRMAQPLVSSQADPGHDPAPSEPPSARPPAENLPGRQELELLLLLPADAAVAADQHRLIRHLETMGFSLFTVNQLSGDYEDDRRLLDELRRYEWTAERGILTVVEAWMPPIRETIDFFRQLRETVGPDPVIFVGLVGRSPQAAVAGPAPAEMKIWRRQVGSLADPQLAVIDLEADVGRTGTSDS